MRPAYLTALPIIIIILSVTGAGRTQNVMAGNSLRREEHTEREREIVWGPRSDLNASSACLPHGLFLCAAMLMSSPVLSCVVWLTNNTGECGQTKFLLQNHASHSHTARSWMQLVSGLLVPLSCPRTVLSHTGQEVNTISILYSILIAQ